MPASRATWTTARAAASSMCQPKLLQPSPTAETRREPMGRVSMKRCGGRTGGPLTGWSLLRSARPTPTPMRSALAFVLLAALALSACDTADDVARATDTVTVAYEG